MYVACRELEGRGEARARTPYSTIPHHLFTQSIPVRRSPSSCQPHYSVSNPRSSSSPCPQSICPFAPLTTRRTSTTHTYAPRPLPFRHIGGLQFHFGRRRRREPSGRDHRPVLGSSNREIHAASTGRLRRCYPRIGVREPRCLKRIVDLSRLRNGLVLLQSMVRPLVRTSISLPHWSTS
jgi:hypothetical protein